MKTQSYYEGYETGLWWNESYRPGGPIVFYAHTSSKADRIRTCQESQDSRQDWLEGFNAGLAKQKESKG